MNQNRFSDVIFVLGGVPTRRDLVHGLAALGLGLGAARFPRAAEAKKRKRKRKRRNNEPKPKLNAFGCVDVGDPCENARQCCSGVCDGKICRAHGIGTCDQEAPGFCAAPDSAASSCGGSAPCLCLRTTGGSNFCAAPLATCRDCRRDADCEAFGLPPGSACVPSMEGECAGNCPDDMACALPCGYVPPAPETP